MKNPTNQKLYDAVFAEVQAKNPNALGYQVDEMTAKEYERRFALMSAEPAFEPESGDFLDQFFAGKFGTK